VDRPEDNLFDEDWDEAEQLVMKSHDAMNPANHAVDDPDGARELVRSFIFGIAKSREPNLSIIHPDLLVEPGSSFLAETVDEILELIPLNLWDFGVEVESQVSDHALVAVTSRDDRFERSFVLIRDPGAINGNPWRIRLIAPRTR
jgi:hypothetical protein